MSLIWARASRNKKSSTVTSGTRTLYHRRDKQVTKPLDHSGLLVENDDESICTLCQLISGASEGLYESTSMVDLKFEFLCSH